MMVLGQYKAVLANIWWCWVSMRRYWLVHDVCQYNLVLRSIKWNWVSTWLLCLNISKKVEIWWDVSIAGRTDEQTNKER